MEEQTSKHLLSQIEQTEIERGEPNPFIINSWPKAYRESFLYPFSQPVTAQVELHAFLERTRQNWFVAQGEQVNGSAIFERMLQLGREQKMLVTISHQEIRSMLGETGNMPLHRIPDNESRQVFDYKLGRERKGGVWFLLYSDG